MWNIQSQNGWLNRWVQTSNSEIDRSVLIGAVLSALLIGIGILSSGKGLNFFDFGSVLVVLGGTCGATIMQFSTYDLRHAWIELKSCLLYRCDHPVERIANLVEFSQQTKRSGMLVLETYANKSSDSFLRKSLELAVDGQVETEMRRILETEMRSLSDRAARATQVLESMANYAPAMGLIGTLIGLIQMLGALDNPSAVGPAMSQALVTTFYGAILANLIFLPIAGKMRTRHQEDALVREITIEGAVSLLKQESPIVLEQRLNSFLPLCRSETVSVEDRKAWH